VVVAVTPV